MYDLVDHIETQWDKTRFIDGLNEFPLILMRLNEDEPVEHGWLNKELTDHSEAFSVYDNIGMKLGREGKVVDVHIRDQIMLQLAPTYLPAPFMRFGTDSLGQSHSLFRVRNAGSTMSFNSWGNHAAVEIKSEGCFTVLPYSVFSNGNPIIMMANPCDTGEFEFADIVASTIELGVAATLSDVWQESNSVKLPIALFCTLAWCGWDVDRICEFLLKAMPDANCEFVGDDEDFSLLAVNPCEGVRQLREFVGDERVDAVLEWACREGALVAKSLTVVRARAVGQIKPKN